MGYRQGLSSVGVARQGLKKQVIFEPAFLRQACYMQRGRANSERAHECVGRAGDGRPRRGARSVGRGTRARG